MVGSRIFLEKLLWTMLMVVAGVYLCCLLQCVVHDVMCLCDSRGNDDLNSMNSHVTPNFMLIMPKKY